MKKLFFLISLLFVFTALCNAQLRPVAFSPAGKIEAYLSDTSVSVTFNKPVAALGESSQLEGAMCPLQITPAVAGKCRWAGTQTLTFTPAKPFATATQYTVTLKAGIASAASADTLAQDFVWTFSTAAPEITQTIPYNNERWLNLTPKLMAAFNIPVDASALLPYCELVGDGVKIPVKISPITPQLFESYFKYSETPSQNIVVIEPVSPLKKGAHYKLIFNRGVPALQGSLTMQKDSVTNFYTYGDLNLISLPKNECLPNNPALTFSNPVAAGEIYKNISFSPALDFKPCDEGNAGWQTQFAAADGQKKYAYNVPLCGLYFKAGQTYSVKIKAGLTDVFGGTLGRDIAFNWSNNGYCPSIDFKGGFGVIESYLNPFHPAAAVNAGDIEVEKQKIDYKDFIPFYKQETEWCAKRKLTGNFISKIWQPCVTKDEGVNTFIDLGPALSPDKAGLVFTQFLNPAVNTGGCWQNAFDSVTNMGLTIKTSAQNTLVWATYLADGNPAKNKEVELRDAKNNLLWQGKTNGNGLASAPGWRELKAERESSWSAPEIWAFVKDGDNVSVISSSFNDGIQPWRFNISYDYQQKDEPYKAFIFTERGMYRTGEDVHIKAVIRQLKEGRFISADVKTAQLTITDPRGKQVLNKTLNVNASAIDYVYTLPASSATGNYDIGLNIGEYNFNQSFRAEALKPAEFKVQLTPLASQYFAGDKAEFALSAQYMFGAALGGAQAKWTVKLLPSYYSPQGWDGYNFNDYEGGADNKEKDLFIQSVNLDDKGNGNIAVQIPLVNYGASIYAQAGVLSPQNQELFARKSVSVLPADIFIGVKTPSSMATAGEPFTMQIVAVNAQGKLLPHTNIEGVLIRKDYLSVRKSGVIGRLEWVSSERSQILQNFILTAEDGKTEWSFTPTQSGSYYLLLKAKDKQGRVNTSRTSFYVSGEGEAYWQQSDDDVLQLSADKEKYSAGDKAKILIKSPFKTAYALITAEREGILYSDTVLIKGGAQYIKVPIKDNFVPNVFVSVVLVQGRTAQGVYNTKGEDLGKPQAKFGYIALNVAPEVHKLTPQIITDKPNYEPGQTVKVNINVKNFKGKGAPATLTVYAVDEGVLALSAYQTPDIFSYFYAASPLSVDTADNRLFLIGQRSFGQKGENRGGGGSADKLGGIDLRSNFKFTPFYSATVKTDKKGRAQVSFVLPDNLTKFRIMAVAAGEEDFGSSQSFIEVSKPVVIKPFLPRFARAGDIFDCGFTVYNYTKEDNLATVLNAALEGGIIFKSKPQESAVIPAGQSITVKGKCYAQKMQDAVFTFTAKNANGADGLKVNVPVLGVSAAQSFATSGATQNSAAEILQNPPHMIDSKNNILQVTLGSSAAVNINAAADYLAKYPYYCLEQRLSKLTPYIFAADKEGKHINPVAQESLDKIEGYQTPAGGFSYWTGSRYGDPYVTAYALDVLFSAQQAGYSIDKEMLNKAVLWLNSYISAKQDTSYQYNAQELNIAKAYGVYALALYGNNNAGAYFSNMYALRGSLGLETKIYLLKAANILNLKNAYDTLKQDILNYAKISNTDMHFEAPSNMWIYSGNFKITALALESLLAGGGFEGDFKVAAWLNNSLKNSPDFGTTADNAFVYRALSKYISVKEAQPSSFTATLTLNGKVSETAQFNAASKQVQVFTEDLKQIFSGKNVKAQFAKEGVGTLYYKALLTYYSAAPLKQQSAGFSVSKAISPAAPLSAGQSATVSVTITTGQDRSFVVLEDFLPAGFEVIDSTLATEGDDESAAEEEDSYTPLNPFIRTENYDDRVVAFADFMPKGTYTFSYEVRAISGGSYAVPAAVVSQMYSPDVFGRSSAADILQIK